MKIKSVSFKNYKAFETLQTIELKPITILIGKNSSGKSSIGKLFTLLQNSLSGMIDEPLLVKNNDVELGAEFRDLIFGRIPGIPLKLIIQFENNISIEVEVVQDGSKFELQIIEWNYSSLHLNLSLLFSKEENIYKDVNGTKYVCKFKGFIPESIINENGDHLEVNFTENLAVIIDYIGPFRILPDRQFSMTGQLKYDTTGIKGENAYSMLAVSKLIKSDLHLKVGEWYKVNFDGWELVIEEKKPFMQIMLSKSGTDINIVDVGQGMNQALPLVVRGHLKQSNSIVVLEQPELHLHPAAHGALVELFARATKGANETFIIETHAENILLRLRKLIVENEFGFTCDDAIIYWIDDTASKESVVKKITIDENGVLSDWPVGVFTENITEILEIQKAIKRKNAT